MPPAAKPITEVKVRMYKMGTGDCISVKFLHDAEVTFSMLFDCGCINASAAALTPFVKELIRDLDGKVDALVLTHEHQDHVLGFQRCEDLLVEGLAVGELWMGWTEDDSKAKVKQWKKDYGEKKMALARAAERLTNEVDSAAFAKQFAGSAESKQILAFHHTFASAVRDFAKLHANAAAGEYKGPLKGMRIAKEELSRDHPIAYLSPGEILYDIPGLDGVRIFVLGPPTRHSQVEEESGAVGESYRHNKHLDPEEFTLNQMRAQLDGSELFVRTINCDGNAADDPSLSPFPPSTFASKSEAKASAYENKDAAWRRIDHEWLQSSANLALRMNGLTNNLSVVLAIQFEESGKVMLFPGDAEFGSWESWHDIDWAETLPDEDVTTEYLLNNTVFYKVAHHLSHNGTAQSLGLEMMDHPELVAMATLNYKVISNGWKSTMPNRAILKALLERTKGRTIIQDTDDLFYDFDEQIPLSKKIKQFQRGMSAEERDDYRNSVLDDEKFVEVSIKI